MLMLVETSQQVVLTDYVGKLLTVSKILILFMRINALKIAVSLFLVSVETQVSDC